LTSRRLGLGLEHSVLESIPAKYLCDRIDAFDMWAIWKILHIPYTLHMTNIEVQHISGAEPLSHTSLAISSAVHQMKIITVSCISYPKASLGLEDPAIPGYVQLRWI